MKKNVCVLVADGSEEMEVVITVDVLRRAGIGVFLWDPTESQRFDVLVIPGGIGGSQIMRQDESIQQVIREFAQAGKILASLCAGPTVLQAAGVLDGKTYTSHPSVREELTAGTWVDQPVVCDGILVTSQAPGTAIAFALKLIELLVSLEMANQVAEGMRVVRSAAS